MSSPLPAAIPPYSIPINIPLSTDILNQWPSQSAAFRNTVNSWLGQISDPDTGHLRPAVMTVVEADPAAPLAGAGRIFLQKLPSDQFPYLAIQHDDGRVSVILAGNATKANGSNLFLNANFTAAQEGASISMTAGDFRYTLDQWTAWRSGGLQTVSRQAFAIGQTDVPGNPTNFLRTARTAAGSIDNFIVAQPVEDVARLATTEITVSVWVRSATTKTYRWGATQFFGTGGSANTVIIGPEFTLQANVWTQLRWFGEIFPSVAGKTIGPGNGSQIGIVELAGDQTTFTFDLANPFLGTGYNPLAVPFVHKNADEELFDVQRYFQTFGGKTAFETIGQGLIFGASGAAFNNNILIPLKRAMRVTPTWNPLSSHTHWEILGVALGAAIAPVTTNSQYNSVLSSPTMAVASFQFDSSNFDLGDIIQLRARNTLDARIFFNARL